MLVKHWVLHWRGMETVTRLVSVQYPDSYNRNALRLTYISSGLSASSLFSCSLVSASRRAIAMLVSVVASSNCLVRFRPTILAGRVLDRGTLAFAAFSLASERKTRIPEKIYKL